MSNKYGIYHGEARPSKYTLGDIILMFQAVLLCLPEINRVYFSVDSRGYNLGLVNKFSAGIVPLTQNFKSFCKPSTGIYDVIKCEFPDSIIEIVGDFDKDQDMARNCNCKFTFASNWLAGE